MVVLPTAQTIARAPPASPKEGDVYIVGANPTGTWSSYKDAFAGFIGGGWVLLRPGEGWRVWIVGEKKPMRYTGGAWTEEKLAGSGTGGSSGSSGGTTPPPTPPAKPAIPAGGKAGQVLVKKSDADGDYEWRTIETGGTSPAPVPTPPAAASVFDGIALYKSNTVYQKGDIVYREETKLRRWYLCDFEDNKKTSGTSGATPPAWKTNAGDQTEDNEIIWITYEGGAAIVVEEADLAARAKKLNKPVDIILTGAVKGSAKFDGAKACTINVTAGTP